MNFFTRIFPRKNQDSILFNHECLHPILIKAKMKGDFSDKITKLYVCTNCGFVHMSVPAENFRNNNKALEYFQKLQKEIKLPKL